MSGIFALVNFDGRPAEPEVVSRLTGILRHRGPDAQEVWTEGPAGLGCALARLTPEAKSERQPLVTAGGCVAVFDGRLDNREELLSWLPELSAEDSDCSIAAAAYERFGEGFAAKLNGDYALVLYDARRRTLLLARDPIGVRPLYYYRGNGLFLGASEIKAIVAHPHVEPRPNADMLANFLIGDSAQDAPAFTFFQNVWNVPPGRTVVATAERVRCFTHWDFSPTEKIRFPSIGEYTEAFRHQLETAVRRRLRYAVPVWSAVSGGLDSSSIYCTAETLRRGNGAALAPLRGIAFVAPAGTPADEEEYRVAIEQQYGVSIERFPMSAPVAPPQPERAAYYSEAPFINWESWSTMYGIARERGGRVFLSGYLGDHLLVGTQAYEVDLLNRLRLPTLVAHMREMERWFAIQDLPEAVRLLLRQFLLYHAPGWLRWRLFERHSRQIRSGGRRYWYSEWLRSRLRQHPARERFDRGAMQGAHRWFMYQYLRSGVHTMRLEWENKLALMDGMDLAFPLADRDLVSFLMSIPGEVHSYQGRQRGLQREALRGILPEPVRLRRSKADISGLLNKAMEIDYEKLLKCLHAGSLAIQFGFVDDACVWTELERERGRLGGSGANSAARITDLLGLEMWLRAFFSDGETRIKSGEAVVGGCANVAV